MGCGRVGESVRCAVGSGRARVKCRGVRRGDFAKNSKVPGG
jgi:hypothetical protein